MAPLLLAIQSNHKPNYFINKFDKNLSSDDEEPRYIHVLAASIKACRIIGNSVLSLSELLGIDIPPQYDIPIRLPYSGIITIEVSADKIESHNIQNLMKITAAISMLNQLVSLALL